MQFIEPYEPRPVLCIDQWDLDGWRLKVYGITYGGSQPDAVLVGTARKIGVSVLPKTPITDCRYGCGFVGVHQGRGANFLFYCWWENENELLHRVFSGAGDQPGDFSEQSVEEVRACVWDIAVIAHERDAWVRHVLSNPAGPDLDDYLADRLNAVV